MCVLGVGMLAQSYRGMSPYWRIECDFPSQYLGDTVSGLQKEARERYIPKNTPPINYFLQLHPTSYFLSLHSNFISTRIHQGINPLILEILSFYHL